jgi:hypothetical protein
MEAIGNWIENHQALAAWIQAIGSIVAILGAYGIAAMQFRHAKQTEIKREERRALHDLQLVFEIIKQAVDLIIEVRVFRLTPNREVTPDDSSYRDAELLRLRDIREILSSVRMQDLGNLDAINSLIAIRRILGKAISFVERQSGSLACGPNRFAGDLEFVDEALTVSGEIVDGLIAVR